MTEKTIYKLGSNYFSTYEKAKEFKDKAYVSNVHIEPIRLDSPNCMDPENLVVTIVWRYREGEGIEKSHYYTSSAPDKFSLSVGVVKYYLLYFDAGEGNKRREIKLEDYQIVSIHRYEKASRDIPKIYKNQALKDRIFKGLKTALEASEEKFSIKL